MIIYALMTSGPKHSNRRSKEIQQSPEHQRRAIMKTRELMQQIQLEEGNRIPEIHLVKRIRSIKNLDNRDQKTVSMWINRLKRFEFIRKSGFNMYVILDTGKSWWEL